MLGSSTNSVGKNNCSKRMHKRDISPLFKTYKMKQYNTCFYQNSKPWHVRVDVIKWGPKLHTSALRDVFYRRGTYKTWDSDAQVRICVTKTKRICLIRLV